jgi:hypothetical protein
VIDDFFFRDVLAIADKTHFNHTPCRYSTIPT